MGQMISPRESVHYKERGGPGRAEHLIAEEWRMRLQKQQGRQYVTGAKRREDESDTYIIILYVEEI